MLDNYYAITHDKERDRRDRMDTIYQAYKAAKIEEFLDNLNNGDYQEAIGMMWYSDDKGVDFIHRAVEALTEAAHQHNESCRILLDDMAEQWAELKTDAEEFELEEIHDEIFNL